MTIPVNFWPRVLGVVAVVCGFFVLFGADNGMVTMNGGLRFVALILVVCGAQFAAFGTLLRSGKNDTEGTFPFWRKK